MGESNSKTRWNHTRTTSRSNRRGIIMSSGTKTCQSCGETIPEVAFTCPRPSCGSLQEEGPPDFPTKVATHLSTGSRLLPAVVPVSRITLPGRPFYVGAVTFCGKARTDLPLTLVEDVVGIELELGPATNIEAALNEASKLLFGDPSRVLVLALEVRGR